MPVGRTELRALRNLISEAGLILETSPALPENRTNAARENLEAALAIADDLIGQAKLNAAAIIGRKGDTAAARKLGSEHSARWRWRARHELVEGRANSNSRTIRT